MQTICSRQCLERRARLTIMLGFQLFNSSFLSDKWGLADDTLVTLAPHQTAQHKDFP